MAAGIPLRKVVSRKRHKAMKQEAAARDMDLQEWLGWALDEALRRSASLRARDRRAVETPA